MAKNLCLVTGRAGPSPAAVNAEPLFHPRGDKASLELGDTLQPKFDAAGLIPCITADARTNEVLMFAFMNEEALRHTIESGKATYFSRSRNKLWLKGEESGNLQYVRELRTDCDQDVILLKVDIGDGAACHTGYRSCFYRRLNANHRLEMAGGEKKFDPADVYGRK